MLLYHGEGAHITMKFMVVNPLSGIVVVQVS